MSKTLPTQPSVLKVRSECWCSQGQGDLHEIPENLGYPNQSRTASLEGYSVLCKPWVNHLQPMAVWWRCCRRKRDQLDHREWLTTGEGHKSLQIYSRVNVVKDLQGLRRHRKRVGCGKFWTSTKVDRHVLAGDEQACQILSSKGEKGVTPLEAPAGTVYGSLHVRDCHSFE